MPVVHSTFADVDYSEFKPITTDTLALVLAGGRGSRLHELTDWRSKPAVPFGGKYKLIDFVLSNCINSGLSSIGVITQYKSHSLNHHIQKGWQFYGAGGMPSIELLPAQQRTKDQCWYTGTADAIYQNLDIIQAHDPKYVLILSADHVYKMNYLPMIQRHIETGAKVTIGTTLIQKSEASQFGVLQSDETGLVKTFTEKPPQSELVKVPGDYQQISMGIYLFDSQYLYEQLCLDHTSTNTENDFGKNVIPRMIAEKHVYSFTLRKRPNEETAYWRDVGTIDSYFKANMELIGVVPSLNLYDRNWPIKTHQAQLAPAKFVIDEKNRSGGVHNSMVCDGSIIIGSRIVNSLISKNVKVDSGSIVRESIVLPNVDIGRNCTIQNAIIDKGCTIPDNFIIGVNKKKDARHFRVTEGKITLVTQTMLDSLKVSRKLAA